MIQMGATFEEYIDKILVILATKATETVMKMAMAIVVGDEFINIGCIGKPFLKVNRLFQSSVFGCVNHCQSIDDHDHDNNSDHKEPRVLSR